PQTRSPAVGEDPVPGRGFKRDVVDWAIGLRPNRGGVDASPSKEKEATKKEACGNRRGLWGRTGVRGGSPDARGGRPCNDTLNGLGLGSGGSAGGGSVTPDAGT